MLSRAGVKGNRKLIWLPQAYLTRGDLEPARGNLHICKSVRELTNIQIRMVTAEQKLCSECICPTNVTRLDSTRLDSRERETQYALKPTTVSSLELIQESVSYCLLRPLLTTCNKFIGIPSLAPQKCLLHFPPTSSQRLYALFASFSSLYH